MQPTDERDNAATDRVVDAPVSALVASSATLASRAQGLFDEASALFQGPL